MNFSIAWMNFKKAYVMVLHSWITSTMGVVGLANEIIV